MTHKEAWAAQIADVKAHMGELRSMDGKSVERLLADRAAEPTRSTSPWDVLRDIAQKSGRTVEQMTVQLEEYRQAERDAHQGIDKQGE